MQTHLIIGNIFSFMSAVCIAISVMQKSKKDSMFWQIWDAFFGSLATWVLSAYAALIISIASVIRNVLSYKDKLSKSVTFVIAISSIIVGAISNNIGIIGWLPIASVALYTVCVYWAKNDQQIRYAMFVNMVLWGTHNFYVQAYSGVVANISLCVWTAVQIVKHKK
ncbi:MAG: YgjV family protein [Alphaproteobacteria bacterium]|nr:YgjV family protein [Alphaproteobacteria bacterium]